MSYDDRPARARRGGPPAEVIVEVPASSANLGPGFDALALALELRLRVTMRPRPVDVEGAAWPPPLLSIQVMGEESASIDRGPSNRVWQAALRLFQEAEVAQAAAGRPFGVELELANEIPLAAGLGSSAAAAVAGLWAANALIGTPVPYARLLKMAYDLEGHADNAAAAALGGFVVCRPGEGRVEALRVPIPRGEIVAVVTVPNPRLSTQESRRAVPASVSHADAVFNLGGSALVVAALTTGRFERLREAMRDRIHQPHRARLMPGLEEAMRAALDAGAYGACLSGAGPSVLALCRPEVSEQVGRACALVFDRLAVAARWLTLDVAGEGARVTARRSGEEGLPSTQERETSQTCL